MEQKILQSIDGISIYGLISIGIFFGFFSGMLIWACMQKKKYLQHMGALPLEDGEKKSTDKNNR